MIQQLSIVSILINEFLRIICHFIAGNIGDKYKWDPSVFKLNAELISAFNSR